MCLTFVSGRRSILPSPMFESAFEGGTGGQAQCQRTGCVFVHCHTDHEDRLLALPPPSNARASASTNPSRRPD